jgi:hypothetical protein
VLDAQVYAGRPNVGPSDDRPQMNGQIRLGHNGMATLPSWPELETVVPSIVDTMRRYLQQIACVLRPGSVSGADLALRSFAGLLVECAPDVTSVADVVRRHV